MATQYAHITNDALTALLAANAALPWNPQKRCSRAVKDGTNVNGNEKVLPFRETKPSLGDGEQYAGYSDAEVDGEWVRTWTVEPAPTEQEIEQARLEPLLPTITQIFAAWQSTGIADMPTSWDDAITLAKSRRSELAETADREALRDAIIELLALRIKLSELGGEWTDVLTVAAQFA